MAGFVGTSNLFTATVLEQRGADTALRAGSDGLVLLPGGPRPTGARVLVAVRPEKIRLQEARSEPGPGLCHARGTISEVVYLGTVTRYLVALEGAGSIVVLEQNLDTTSMEALEAQGRAVRLTWQPRHTFVIGDGDHTHTDTEAP